MWNFKPFEKNVAVVEEKSNSVTYAELSRLSNAFLQNIPSRSLIFNLSSNCLGALVGYVSCVQGKHVSLMLDDHIDKDLLSHFVLTYKPDYLWVPNDQTSYFEGQSIFSESGYTLVKTPFNHEYPLYEELALMLTTSGSTGSPKFVRQSYKNLEANTKAIVEYLHLDASERPITTLPMNYTYGLSIINSHLMVGATILLTDKTLMQRDFWDFMNNQHATSFGGVPYTYEMLNKLMFFRRKLPDLRTMTQAGGKLLPELHQKFAEYAEKEGKKFIVMYGQAEATARMAYLPPDVSLEKVGSMGIAIPGGRFELHDENNQVITEAETVGELVYYGDNVTLGYASSGEDLAKPDERYGVLYTGDMAKFDKDGYFYVVGRKKRFLKIFGNRVGLDETERLIKSKYCNIECACSGKDDALYVFINKQDLCSDIKKYLAEKTKLNPVAFHVQFLEQIPKNEVGKTMYKELEKFYDKVC